MAGLCSPLPTLRRCPRGHLRTARGRCGSLRLHRSGLSPPTPCRSPGALQISLRSALALDCTDFGSLLRTFMVLCIQHRCCRVAPNSSSNAFHKPSAPSPMANSGGTESPRAFKSAKSSRQDWGAFPITRLETYHLLFALRCGANQHKDALLVGLHAPLQVDAICPDIDITPGREIAPFPAFEFLLPPRFQPGKHRGRQIWGILAEQGRQRLLKITRRGTAQIKHRQQRIQASGPPGVRRRDRW